ncbi:MAG: ATP-binding protein [Acidimicrobiia bacterium]|nr:ATP-binding protein [Acidimicrobiia bacterium]
MVGGGSRRAQPGEVTLAHRGVLFCDELGEFAPATLDALRQPLEEGTIRIARQTGTVTFPARFLLVACSNPCPCGRDARRCRCSDSARFRYERRLSDPLLDRFDLRLRVEPPDAHVGAGDDTATTAGRVLAAVEAQTRRYSGLPWSRNGDVPAGALDDAVPMEGDLLATWRALCERRRLNGRGAAAIRRVARTLADLEGDSAVGPAHLLRAADLREPWS